MARIAAGTANWRSPAHRQQFPYRCCQYLCSTIQKNNLQFTIHNSQFSIHRRTACCRATVVRRRRPPSDRRREPARSKSTRPLRKQWSPRRDPTLVCRNRVVLSAPSVMVTVRTRLRRGAVAKQPLSPCTARLPRWQKRRSPALLKVQSLDSTLRSCAGCSPQPTRSTPSSSLAGAQPGDKVRQRRVV